MSDLPRVHVHMTVSDLDKSRDFYTRFLGVAPVKEKPGYVKFLPGFGPLNLALSAARGDEGRGHVDHMGIQVDAPQVVRRELARVKAAGLTVREEMSVDCCHANQDKFWVEDPDGVEWEVYFLNYDLEDNAVTAPTGAVKGLRVVSSGGCCTPA